MNYHSMRTLEVVGFFVMAGLMQGCDRTIHVIQLDQPPNSFAFDQSNHKGDVLSVTVTTHDPNRTVAWRVQADKHVSCRGFRVTAGELLDGFSQTVPELPRGDSIGVTSQLSIIGSDSVQVTVSTLDT